MKEEKVYVPSGSIRLEGLLSIHEALPFKGGVIFCHPHPQYGGDMHNSIISTCVEAAFEEGFSTLRFNFRGVGESEGSYGEGIEERKDVEAAAEYLCSKLNNPNFSLILLGYSFGAWAGFPVAIENERIKGVVGIAPPLEIYDFGFLRGCKKKKLIMAGDRDPYCPVRQLEGWFRNLDQPKSLAIIQGADHFFLFHQATLTRPLKDFLKVFSRSEFRVSS